MSAVRAPHAQHHLFPHSGLVTETAGAPRAWPSRAEPNRTGLGHGLGAVIKDICSLLLLFFSTVSRVSLFHASVFLFIFLPSLSDGLLSRKISCFIFSFPASHTACKYSRNISLISLSHSVSRNWCVFETRRYTMLH